MNAKEEVLDQVEQVISLAEKRINDFVAGEWTEHFGSTSLAKDIVRSTGFAFTFVCPLVSMYITLHPKVIAKKGKGGGCQLVQNDSSS